MPNNTESTESEETTLCCPTHPGEVLLEDQAKPLGLSAEDLDDKCGFNKGTTQKLFDETTPVTQQIADALCKLEHFPSAEYWMNLQNHYDIQLRKSGQI